MHMVKTVPYDLAIDCRDMLSMTQTDGFERSFVESEKPLDSLAMVKSLSV